MRKAPTIRDVAAEVGVSVATVSRVLNRKGNVSAETGERVRAAAAALGFRPSLQARGMRGTAPLIGMVMGERLPPYVTEVQWGVAERCGREAYHLVVGAHDGDAAAGAEAARRMIDALNIAGLVLFPPLADEPAVLDLVREKALPCARLSAEDAAGIPTVRTDEVAAARDMTRHLLELGHRDIALIAGHPGHRASALRREGYAQALEAAGIAPDPERIAPGLFDFESGQEAAAALLSSGAPPTAILASNDSMALGAISAAKAMGLRVGRDVSVAGFDDVPAARLVRPALTTMRQPIREMAETAAELVFAQLAGETPPAPPVAAFELIVRESTGPAPR